jgi:predicted metal-dependent enzyme (double-stranded beta helix superfamily)
MPEVATALDEFVRSLETLVDARRDEPQVLEGCRAAMKRLVARDDWLPEAMARPHPKYYQQYLLHCDARERFCVVSFVWGPGQGTPVHDHTVWGVIGVLRGGERCTRYRLENGIPVRDGEDTLLEPGHIDVVSPSVGDIHRVANAFDDRVSVSIHAYGANIGNVRRHVYEPDGRVKEFMSSYANAEA